MVSHETIKICTLILIPIFVLSFLVQYVWLPANILTYGSKDTYNCDNLQDSYDCKCLEYMIGFYFPDENVNIPLHNIFLDAEKYIYIGFCGIFLNAVFLIPTYCHFKKNIKLLLFGIITTMILSLSFIKLYAYYFQLPGFIKDNVSYSSHNMIINSFNTYNREININYNHNNYKISNEKFFINPECKPLHNSIIAYKNFLNYGWIALFSVYFLFILFFIFQYLKKCCQKREHYNSVDDSMV
jgi:hypothetical protein